MTDPLIALFPHDEISSAGCELARARYRLHAVSMIAISRLVTATFPTARELVVDCSLRTLDPVGPTLVAILDDVRITLFHDDTQPHCAGEGEPELARMIERVCTAAAQYAINPPDRRPRLAGSRSAERSPVSAEYFDRYADGVDGQYRRRPVRAR